VGERKVETSTDKKSRDIYNQFSPINFHPPLWPTRVPIHAQTPTQFHPYDFTHLFSQTHFHPPISPTFFSPIFFHRLFFALSFFTLTDSFYLLRHRSQFSPTILCALVSPNTRFHLIVNGTHLQISLNCRFHLLADFIYLHLSCWLMLLFFLRFRRHNLIAGLSWWWWAPD